MLHKKSILNSDKVFLALSLLCFLFFSTNILAHPSSCPRNTDFVSEKTWLGYYYLTLSSDMPDRDIWHYNVNDTWVGMILSGRNKDSTMPAETRLKVHKEQPFTIVCEYILPGGDTISYRGNFLAASESPPWPLLLPMADAICPVKTTANHPEACSF